MGGAVPTLVASDGVPLHYRDEGRGRPVVFVHGWTMSGRFFDLQVEELAPERRVVVPDLRGCGASGTRPGTHHLARFADDLDELVRHLGLRDATILGWSMGGGVTMRYLDRHGADRVRGVGLVDFPPEFREAAGVADKVCERLRTSRDRFIASFLKRMVLEEPTAEELAWMVTEHMRAPVEAACESYRQMGEGSSLGRAYDLPGLLVFPTNGWYRPALEAWKRIFPRHVAPAFERSRHAPFLEEPRAFADAVRTFTA